MSWGLSEEVTIMTFTLTVFERSSLAKASMNWKPSITGMFKSTKITSGKPRLLIWSSASLPFNAVFSSLTIPSLDNTLELIKLEIASSSINSTFITIVLLICSAPLEIMAIDKTDFPGQMFRLVAAKPQRFFLFQAFKDLNQVLFKRFELQYRRVAMDGIDRAVKARAQAERVPDAQGFIEVVSKGNANK